MVVVWSKANKNSKSVTTLSDDRMVSKNEPLSAEEADIAIKQALQPVANHKRLDFRDQYLSNIKTPKGMSDMKSYET